MTLPVLRSNSSRCPDSRNPKLPFPIFAARFDVVITQARRIVRIVRIMPDRSGRRIQTVQTLSRRQPQYSGAVLTDVADERNRVTCKRLGSSIESIDELIASDPQRAIAILEEGANIHPAEAVGISWVVNEQFEVVAVVPVQPVLRAKPHEALDRPARSEPPSFAIALRPWRDVRIGGPSHRPRAM